MPTELSAQEAAVLDMIAHNPFAGQQEIADALGLARSTVAAHIVSLMQKGRILGRGYVLPSRRLIACVGGAVLDRKFRARGVVRFEADNEVESERSHGGMARNVAETLARLGDATSLVSIVGDDETGREIRNALRDLGVDVSAVAVSDSERTAEYSLVLDHRGDLMMGLTEMSVFEQLTRERLERVWPHLAGASWIFCDANPPRDTIAALIARARAAGIPLALAGVSEKKMRHLPADLTGVELLIVTVDEARAVLSQSGRGASDAPLAEALIALGARNVVVIGETDICCADGGRVLHLPPAPATLIDATGAADGFVAATLDRLADGETLGEAVRAGALLYALTLESPGTVRTDLTPELMKGNRARLGPAAPEPRPAVAQGIQNR